ncbi:hypothetical protein BGZ46_001905 [Entomortierella lignicola]|nr:hypothetical protein BGZ46_001905 [Entomortierella lignicola]
MKFQCNTVIISPIVSIATPDAFPVGRPALAEYGSRRIQLHLSLEQEADYGLSLEQEADYGSRRIQPRLNLEQEVA